MTVSTDPARKRTRIFVAGFVAAMAVLLAAALYINIANPFGLHLKPVPVEDGGAAEAASLEPLVIETAAGPKALKVEIADDAAEMSRGLMFRQSMPDDQGMLFVHAQDGERSMWMKNTYIPLDMLFIESNGRVHRIEERTVPFSEQTIGSQGPVRAVLELNGGQAAALGVKPGDVIRHKAFGNAP